MGDGEKEATLGWLVMQRLSVVLTQAQWMELPAREVLEMINSMYVDSVESCLTVRSPWVPMTSRSFPVRTFTILSSLLSFISFPSSFYSLSSSFSSNQSTTIFFDPATFPPVVISPILPSHPSPPSPATPSSSPIIVHLPSFNSLHSFYPSHSFHSSSSTRVYTI